MDSSKNRRVKIFVKEIEKKVYTKSWKIRINFLKPKTISSNHCHVAGMKRIKPYSIYYFFLSEIKISSYSFLLANLPRSPFNNTNIILSSHLKLAKTEGWKKMLLSDKGEFFPHNWHIWIGPKNTWNSMQRHAKGNWSTICNKFLSGFK